jgi:nitroimidazol reductase NimA-like FMN-containing flavoprotein (pyridoxamine 5'-phosphate oxidase superfamily)
MDKNTHKHPKRDKAIKDIAEIGQLEEIISKCQICHVAMSDGEFPYVLGFNFGYKDGIIYLHSVAYGKKIDILKKNPNVCVSFSNDYNLFARNKEVGCSWRMAYRSVLAYGKAEFVNDYDEKLLGLNLLMSQYTSEEFKFNKPAVDNITIIRIRVNELTGRSFEY